MVEIVDNAFPRSKNGVNDTASEFRITAKGLVETIICLTSVDPIEPTFADMQRVVFDLTIGRWPVKAESDVRA